MDSVSFVVQNRLRNSAQMTGVGTADLEVIGSPNNFILSKRLRQKPNSGR